MTTTAERIVEALRDAGEPLNDSQLAALLGVRHQAINQACRSLAVKGVLTRQQSVGSSIVNVLNAGLPSPPEAPVAKATTLLTEDEVKAAVGDQLQAQGYRVKVALGHERGIDIDAHKHGDHLLIEAKGEVSLQPQQANYFIGALGELVQKMAYPDARYGLALPDSPQYRRLVGKLPAHARKCLHLVVFFVSRNGDDYAVVEA